MDDPSSTIHPQMNALDLVKTYLTTRQQQGITRLPVDEDARRILRAWMLAAKRGKRSAAEAPPPQPPADRIRETTAEPSADPSWLRQPDPEEAAPPSEEPALPFFRPAGESVEEKWSSMERMLPHWEPLRELHSLREKAVLGIGNRRASIMFVGDAPNYLDEQEGKPFQGEAGGKLDGILKAMGLTREQVYITHIVKFRPWQPRQTRNTRPPSEREILLSSPIFDCEVRLVQPRVIVALGVIAARGILRRGDLPLSAYQEQRGEYNGIPVIVTHHPSYLLRTSDLAERRRLWEEMLAVMQTVGMPISLRQRRYFLPADAP